MRLAADRSFDDLEDAGDLEHPVQTRPAKRIAVIVIGPKFNSSFFIFPPSFKASSLIVSFPVERSFMQAGCHRAYL